MINKLSFKNYKAFIEGEVKIRPITILLGANSVGKSSIMQLFLMLQQTALSEGNYKSALKLHGGFVSLGEGLNLIRKKNNAKTLSLSIDFYNNRIFEELREEYLVKYCQEVYYFASIIQKFSQKRKLSKHKNVFQYFKKYFANNDFDVRYLRLPEKKLIEIFNQESFYNLVNATHDLINQMGANDIPKDILEDAYLIYGHYSIQRPSRPVNHFRNLKERKDEYLLTYDFLNGIRVDAKKAHYKISYDITINDKLLVLKKVSIYTEENEIISIEYDNHAVSNIKPLSITSKYFDQAKLSEKTLQSVKDIFNNSRTIFSFINDYNEKDGVNNSVLAYYLRPIVSSFNTATSDYFKDDNINYVSPLRAHPKRYYFLDKAKLNAFVDTLDGDAIAETLKENSSLRSQVNTWLEKFNLKIEVSQLQDIIHKLVVNQNSLSLDITDVGFGISQVLPVIIQGFLSHENSLTLIEQPEIHLHPKMQADLADLFIDIVHARQTRQKKDRRKYLLVETHSEYLLKRLRRRISEGKISPEDVAIYLIDPQTEEKGAIIKELQVKERGQFDWPIDFYGGELLKDTTEYIKNQQKAHL
jgi:predicted ATPase